MSECGHCTDRVAELLSALRKTAAKLHIQLGHHAGVFTACDDERCRENARIVNGRPKPIGTYATH